MSDDPRPLLRAMFDAAGGAASPAVSLPPHLKGIAPPQIKLTEIFSGVLPYCGMVIICMVLMYVFPQIVFSLPEAFYGPSR